MGICDGVPFQNCTEKPVHNAIRHFSCLGLFGSREKLLLPNSGDPDQMRHNAASDLGLHCLPMYPF